VTRGTSPTEGRVATCQAWTAVGLPPRYRTSVLVADRTCEKLQAFVHQISEWSTFHIHTGKQKAPASCTLLTWLPHCDDCCWISSPAVFGILSPKRLGSWPWPFRVTWRHRSRDHSILHRSFFPIYFFRQFFGKTHSLDIIQTTDRRQKDDIPTQYYSIYSM